MMERTIGSSDNVEQYFARMLSSLGDKKRMITHLPAVSVDNAPLVLDVGCGDGSLVKAMNSLGYSAFGLDASEDSISKCEDNGVFAVKGYAQTLCDAVGSVVSGSTSVLDAVVASAIVHEIYSYGGGVIDAAGVDAVKQFFVQAYEALKPGGVLVVRDGVAPVDSEDEQVIAVDDIKAVRRFMMESPFSVNNGGSLELYQADDNAVDNDLRGEVDSSWSQFIGSRASAAEFAFTYTWGWGSWPREVQEYYSRFSIDDMIAFGNDAGFDVSFVESYIQDGYEENMDKRVRFVDGVFPKTNAVYVFIKK